METLILSNKKIFLKVFCRENVFFVTYAYSSLEWNNERKFPFR